VRIVEPEKTTLRIDQVRQVQREAILAPYEGTWRVYVLPGFERATIAPIPLDLRWCEGRVPTPHGEIAVAWSRNEDAFSIGVTLPEGVRADIILPCETDEFGEPNVTGEGAIEAVRAAGLWKVRLAEGAKVSVVARRRAAG